MNPSLNRRQAIGAAGIAAVAGALEAASAAEPAAAAAAAKEVRYCLNMSTIRGQKLPVPEQVDVAAKAGYDAIEPWMGDLHQFIAAGGSAADLKKRIADAGLTVESAIGFAEWIVDDDARRAAGLENAKKDMDLIRRIGGTRIAAPPSGATQQADLNLFKAAERYRDLLLLGDQLDVTPQVEVWGFSKSLSRLGETALVAIEARHRRACILPDVYHLYKGGSEFAALRMLSGQAVHVFHMNDYPAEPPRERIADKDRVYPGDGVAPLTQILRDLFSVGFRGVLSLELFNPEYWKQDALLVARTGLEKMKAAVAKAAKAAVAG
ncbi:MAG TPA: sugar phosphate isomerase/epimerase [Pirellulaceae bacterium]|nr:sugar phosphate isomerase/epimerase [Pirellulaceae bacterium]